MPHPDLSRLIQYATADGRDAAFAWHVANCADCATEVEHLRSALDILRANGSATLPAGPACLDEHVIAALAVGELALPERESGLAHMGRCAHCRRAVASVASAMASEDVRNEIANLARPARRGRLRVVLPLTAAAALLLLLLPSGPREEPALHRSAATPPRSAPVVISPSGVTTSVRALRWHSVPAADRYRVTLFDGDGSVLWESMLPDTVISVPDDLPLEPGRAYYWIVSARIGFDRWETSALVEFSIAAGSER